MRTTVLAVLSALCLVVQAHSAPALEDLQVRILWQLRSDKDYQGAVLRGVVDAKGRESYLATAACLYRVKDGRTKLIAEQPERDARLSLAPGGGIYGWLTQKSSWKGLFSVRLHDISGAYLSELRLKEFPYGFGSLYLGFQGRLIVTSSPLDDWQGLVGKFRIVFWGRDGVMLSSFVLEGRHSAVLDPSGDAILFLGEKGARAFSASGKELWGLRGNFRKAALAQRGRIAILNPSEAGAINQVVIFRGEGKPVKAKAPTPVHGLTMTPDGSLAVVIGDKGRYFHLDLREATLREAQRLPLKGNFFIFNAEFVNEGTLVFGALERVGESREEIWPRGTIIVVDREGNIAFDKVFPVSQATSFYPAVSAAFGGRYVIGFTQESAILIELDNGR
jgi:hypothetical protein